MPSIHLENLSPFGRLAVQLDGDFTELSRLSAQIQRLDIESDSGLEHALKILNQFAQHAQNIAAGITDFSKLLQDAHQQSDAATRAVAERAQQISQRREKENQIREKLAQVEQNVKTASDNLAKFKKSDKTSFSEDEKRHLTTALEALNSELAAFVANAQSIKEEASELKFKNLERTALSLLDTLQASRRKIHEAISRQ